MISIDKINVSLHTAHLHPATSWEVTNCLEKSHVRHWRKGTRSAEYRAFEELPAVPCSVRFLSVVFAEKVLNEQPKASWFLVFNAEEIWACAHLLFSVFFKWGRLENFSSLRVNSKRRQMCAKRRAVRSARAKVVFLIPWQRCVMNCTL